MAWPSRGSTAAAVSADMVSLSLLFWLHDPQLPPPYSVRATISLQVGFLYLRYVCNPRELWGWFKKYARDSEVSASLSSWSCWVNTPVPGLVGVCC